MTTEELEEQVEAARKEKSAAWNTMVYYRDKYNEKNDRYKRLFRTLRASKDKTIPVEEERNPRIIRARAMLGAS